MTAERRRTWATIAGAAALLVAAHALDFWAISALALPSANDRDWGRLLRVLGFAPTWLVVAGVLWLEGSRRQDDAGRQLRTTAGALVLAVAVGGLGSELLKLLFRRARPDPLLGGYLFRSFLDAPFSSRGFGLPSGHTMVAFSALAALAHRFRRAAPVLFGLGIGCGLTRVFARAHFLSDVTAGAIGGTLVGLAVARWLDRRRGIAAG